jgi:hypothetical protein
VLDAGIVHQNIERADLDFESIDSFSHRGMIGDVERERPNVAAEKSGGLLQLGSVPPVQNDLGAGASETSGQAEPDSLARSGYEGPSAGQVEQISRHHLPLLKNQFWRNSSSTSESRCFKQICDHVHLRLIDDERRTERDGIAFGTQNEAGCPTHADRCVQGRRDPGHVAYGTCRLATRIRKWSTGTLSAQCGVHLTSSQQARGCGLMSRDATASMSDAVGSGKHLHGVWKDG